MMAVAVSRTTSTVAGSSSYRMPPLPVGEVGRALLKLVPSSEPDRERVSRILDTLSPTLSQRERELREIYQNSSPREGVSRYVSNTPPPSFLSLGLPQSHLLPKEEDLRLESPSLGEGVARYEPGQGSVESPERSSVQPPHPNPLPLGSGVEGATDSSAPEGGRINSPLERTHAPR